MAEQAIHPGANVGRDPVFNQHGAPRHGLPGREARTPGTPADGVPESSAGTAQAGGGNAFDGNGFGFSDVLDMVNPLQHIPVVGDAYRAITGDEIGSVARMVGGAAYGGPVGLAGATASVAMESATGDSLGGHMMAWLTGGETGGETQMASSGKGNGDAGKQQAAAADGAGKADAQDGSGAGKQVDYVATVQQANRLLAATPPPELVNGGGGTASAPAAKAAGQQATPGRPTAPAEQEAGPGSGAPTRAGGQGMYQRPDDSLDDAAAAAAERYPDGLPAEQAKKQAAAEQQTPGRAASESGGDSGGKSGGDSNPLIAAQADREHPLVGDGGQPRGSFADTVKRNLEKYRAMAEEGPARVQNGHVTNRDDRS